MPDRLGREYDDAVDAAKRLRATLARHRLTRCLTPLADRLVARLERAARADRLKVIDRRERAGLISPLTAETLRMIDEYDRAEGSVPPAPVRKADG